MEYFLLVRFVAIALGTYRVAHCFFDESRKKLYKSNLYTIVTGRYKPGFDWPQEDVQKSTVRSLIVPTRYCGLTDAYTEDIALVRLNNPFNLNIFIRPICMDWDNTYESEHFRSGNLGKLNYWSRTGENNDITEVREIRLPFISIHECILAVPVDFESFLTSDKFCTGHPNGSGVCAGGSGSGIAFRTGDIWYLRGVLSVAPVGDSGNMCGNIPALTFTNVGKFIDWIRVTSALDKWSEDRLSY